MEIKESSLSKMYQFYQQLVTQGILLVYEGEVNHQLTKTFTSMAEENMERISEDSSVRKKVFHVMVECLQNLCKHTEYADKPDSPTSGDGVFMVGRNEDAYYVVTGNYVEEEKKAELTKLLDHINSLDKDGLKELYVQQLKEGSISEKGGAGLGFIDMARKTGQKLEYHFESAPDGRYCFFLKTTIVRRKN